MNEYRRYVARLLLQVTLLLILGSVMLMFLGHRHLIPAMLLGGSGSIGYLMLMAYRIYRLDGLPIKKAIAYMRAGWVLRLMFLAVMLILILKLTHTRTEQLTAFIALLTLHITIHLSGLYAVFHHLTRNITSNDHS